jgi:hypothetical protein
MSRVQNKSTIEEKAPFKPQYYFRLAVNSFLMY